MGWRIVEGDCVAVMAAMEPASIDAIATDPPYGIEFMGRTWDRLEDGWRDGGGMGSSGLAGGRPTEWVSFGGETANPTCATCGGRARGERRCSCEEPDWRVRGEAFDRGGRGRERGRRMEEWHHRWAIEALRVLKPGAHLLAFGGSRTAHRLTSALEEAGFEIRDTIAWGYGSGFPKSRNVSKAIDEEAGAARERVPASGGLHRNERLNDDGWVNVGDAEATMAGDEPVTEEAARWVGWGTALKPSYEPVVVARRPLEGTVAANVVRHGTGAINVSGGRIATSGESWAENEENAHEAYSGEVFGRFGRQYAKPSDPAGRWPGNVALAHDEDCVPVGVESVRSDGHHPGARGAGGLGTSGHSGQGGLAERHADGEVVERWACVPGCPVRDLDDQTRKRADGAGASRFFFVAKTSRVERSAGLDDFEVRPLRWSSGDQNPGSFQAEGTEKASRNPHPTVKPIELMRWLVRLVTPPGGTVLDPFAGSGSTGAAAVLEGVEFVGVERDPEYVPVARARIAWWAERRGMTVGEALGLVKSERRRRAADATAGQSSFDL